MSADHQKIPRLILHLATRQENRESILGDLAEEYEEVAAEKGRFGAYIWYWFHALKAIPGSVNANVGWSFAMFRNYLKISIRNIGRNKIFSTINIAGLALGMAVGILLFIWISDELSYDRFHTDSGRLYRVNQVGNSGSLWAASSAPLANTLEETYPEITRAIRLQGTGPRGIKIKNILYQQWDGLFAEQDFLDFFNFPLVKGRIEEQLTGLGSIVITASLAKKYFGNDDPIGQTIRFDRRFDLKVTGILKNIPRNTHLQFDYIVPFKLLSQYGYDLTDWGVSNYTTYIRLNNTADPRLLERKIENVPMRYRRESNFRLRLQPVTEIHLTTGIAYDFAGTSDKKYVYIFSFTGIFILLIACINFMNLSTARAGNRAKEVGIRKVSGACRRNILLQFFGESLFMSIIAFFLAIVIAQLFLPYFNSLTGKQFSHLVLFRGNIITGAVLIALMTGIIAGIYPAVVLSSFRPVSVLKGTLSKGGKGKLFRRVLVVVQFSISIFLIIGTVSVYQQLRYMQNMNIGIDRDHVLYLRMNRQIRENYETVRDEIAQDPAVISVTGTGAQPGEGRMFSVTDFEWEGKPMGAVLALEGEYVDFGYLETYNLALKEGRGFSRQYGTDKKDAIIINEEAVRAMGLKHPLGTFISFGIDSGYVIGVVKDYHFKSLHNKIDPLVLKIGYKYLKYIIVKVRSDNIEKTFASLNRICDRFSPGENNNFRFVDSAYEDLYRKEQNTGNLAGLFTGLAILISCLGLIGLASFLGELRSKEFGIRKTLGASVFGLAYLISREFIVLVCVSNLFAWPAGYFAVTSWLNDFAYAVKLNPLVFFGAGFLTILIALSTVSYQAFKSALANPVQALKNE